MTSTNLFSKTKYYIKLSQEIQSDLLKHPYNWSNYQEIFNSSVEQISIDILEFEKENMANFESKVYKFKKIFERRYRHYFLYGEYPRWCYEKPFGYTGDFKIMDEIYKNKPTTVGFDGLWDHYFQQMTAAKATRQRKEDLKKIILDFVKNHRDQEIRIMNLGSGPAREIKELLDTDHEKLFSKVTFDCYDFDIRAINYAKTLVNNANNVNFFQKNAIRFALKKDVKKEFPYTYDLIYSAGLIDYLDDELTSRLIVNLKKLLKKEGMMIVTNFGDKYNNSSAGLMEWVTEWYLFYRTEEKFRKIFIDAGVSPKNLKLVPQDNNKVILYCFINSE